MKNKLIIFCTVCVLGGIFYSANTYRQRQNGDSPISTIVPSPSPNAVPSPVVSPSPAPSVKASPSPVKVKILDASSWEKFICGPVIFKIPPGNSQKCTTNPDGSQDVVITEEGAYGSTANISVRAYDGGSRRQYWIKTIQASPADITKYMRFQESLFGTVSGLDVFASGGWWQGGYVSPILIAKDKTIVAIFGGRDFKDQTGEIVRWDITDTIASTIRFTN